MSTLARVRALISVFLVVAIDNCGYAMVFVLFPSLFLDPKYGLIPIHPSLTMGILYAAFPIAQLIGAPLIGELADRYGRRKLFLITVTGTILSYFLTGFSLALGNIPLLFCSRFLTGFFAGNQGLCNAAIADLSPHEKERARNFGIFTVVWGLSFIISLFLGGFLSNPSLSSHFSPAFPFYIMAGASIFCLVILAFFYLETYQTLQKRIHIDLIKGFHNIIEALKKPKTRPLFILMLVWAIGWSYSLVWFGSYSIKKFGVSQSMITSALIAQGILWTMGGSIIKPLLLKVMDVTSIAKLSYLTCAIVLAITAFMTSFYSFAAVYAISAVMGAISLSSTFNLISMASHATVQGRAMGLTQSITSLGFFLVPLIGGVTGDISINTFYPIAACCMLFGFFIVLSQRKKIL